MAKKFKPLKQRTTLKDTKVRKATSAQRKKVVATKKKKDVAAGVHKIIMKNDMSPFLTGHNSTVANAKHKKAAQAHSKARAKAKKAVRKKK